MKFTQVLSILLITAAAPALAQDRDSKKGGLYLGVEAGAADHHFVYQEASPSGQATSKNVTKWGIGGGIFAGYDAYVDPKVRIGAEVSLNLGGQTPSILSLTGQRLAIAPRYGYSLTVRAGYALGDDLVVYGGGGYGGHRYRVTAPAGATDITDWNSSFILVGGVEYKASSNVNVRVEFIHLDGTRNQIMVGIPIRF